MQNSKENYVEESLDFSDKYHNGICKKHLQVAKTDLVITQPYVIFTELREEIEKK